MNLHRVVELARAKMDENGLLDWHFEFSEEHQVLGCCDKARKLIRVSRSYAELNGKADVLDTILHEIAHALTLSLESDAHGKIWQEKCVELGCRPEPFKTTPFQQYRPILDGVCKKCLFRHKRTKGRLLKFCIQCSTPISWNKDL